MIIDDAEEFTRDMAPEQLEGKAAYGIPQRPPISETNIAHRPLLASGKIEESSMKRKLRGAWC